MKEVAYILFGAGWTWITSLALGKLLLRRLGVRLYRQEETPLAFMAGSACLSLIVFLLCAVHLFYKGTVLAVGALALAAAWRLGAWVPNPERLPAMPRKHLWLGGLVAAPFFVLCLANAMAPEMSPDGNSYHLGLVFRYYRENGFRPIATNIYANLSQGVEMLFLYSFAFGKHSASALTHFSFLVALPWMMLNYSRRFGFAGAGLAGALLVFLSPVVGLDGSSAYNDVAVSAILFAVFYLVQVWDQTRSNSLLVPLGLLAGFAYAAKYTAVLAVPYAIGWVVWKSRKIPVRMVMCAALMIVPWMAKNALWVDNPVSPFFNRWFPNPYVHVSFEDGYRDYLRNYGLSSKWQIPLEATVRGNALCGVLGPLFLLSPLGLLALRNAQGRKLLGAAAIFGVTYFSNIGTRFLIPPLPYLALAMSLVLARWPAVLGVVVLAHALSAWPDVLKQYCAQYAWRLDRVRWKQALRIESQDGFLKRIWPNYAVARMMEEATRADGGAVLTFNGASEAYTTRDVLVSFQSAKGSVLTRILHTPLIPDYPPVKRLSFRFPAAQLRRVRAVQTAQGTDDWSIAEFRVYRDKKELSREPQWRLRAQPNPWDVRDAFDNGELTCWASWEKQWPGMFVEADLGRLETVDEVVLEMANNQGQVRVELWGEGATGGLRKLVATGEVREVAPPLSMRREAITILKERGIGYILSHENDFGAKDLADRNLDWGITRIGEAWGFRLFRIN